MTDTYKHRADVAPGAYGGANDVPRFRIKEGNLMAFGGAQIFECPDVWILGHTEGWYAYLYTEMAGKAKAARMADPMRIGHEHLRSDA